MKQIVLVENMPFAAAYDVGPLVRTRKRRQEERVPRIFLGEDDFHIVQAICGDAYENAVALLSNCVVASDENASKKRHVCA